MKQSLSDAVLYCNRGTFPMTDRTGKKKINHPRNIEAYQTMYSKQLEKSEFSHFKGVEKFSNANARKLGPRVEKKEHVFCFYFQRRIVSSGITMHTLF